MSWIKSFKNDYESWTAMFCEEILDLFQKIPVTLPKNIDYIKKGKLFFTDNEGKWFTDKHKKTLHLKVQY